MHTGTLDTGFFCAYRTRPTTAVLCAITVHLYTARMCVRSQPRCLEAPLHGLTCFGCPWTDPPATLGHIRRSLARLVCSPNFKFECWLMQVNTCRLRRLVTTRATLLESLTGYNPVKHWIQKKKKLLAKTSNVGTRLRRHLELCAERVFRAAGLFVH